MRTVVQDKYFLRDVHREIDLYDRKMIHLVKHETFATDALRDAAIRKLSLKREGLVNTAKSLAASGIEFADHDLPRSLRPEGWVDERIADTEATASATAAAVAVAQGIAAQAAAGSNSNFGAQVARLQRTTPLGEESPLAAALGSWENDLAAYKKKRRKLAVAL